MDVAVLSGPGLSLPVEVLEMVLVQLPHSFLITTCTAVCRRWWQLIRNPAFLPWKKLYHRFKLAPSSQCPAFLLIHDGGGVLTAEEQVESLCLHHKITSLTTCLVNIIRTVGEIQQAPRGISPDLLQRHPLYRMARDTLHPLLLPHPPTLWHVVAAIVVLSRDVWDVHSLFRLLLHPGSIFCSGDVVEGLYCLALFFYYCTISKTIKLPTRYHYLVFYALNLYENGWTVATEKLGAWARHSTHRGQQSTERYIHHISSKQLTHEQLCIINHPLQPGHVVKIVAFAGTGKTTTLMHLCNRRPDQKFLLVVYNKSVQEHCSQTFPKNTKVRTAHSLAFAAVGRRFQKIDKLTNNLKASSISQFLEFKKGAGNRYRRVALARKALETYLTSADEHLSLQHVPTADKHEAALDDNFRLRLILPDAEAMWREMTKCSHSQQLPMTQEGQLKLWQLSRPKLSDYNVLLMDEGQDMNPPMLEVLLAQQGAKVIVGDPYQQIYSFRGAVNALESVPSTHTFYLTQSFRFGPEVSYVANCLLESLTLAHRQTLVGGHKRDSITATHGEMETLCLASKKRRAYLGRTNFSVYVKALQMCLSEEGSSLRMAFAGGLKTCNLDMVMDIYKLSQRNTQQPPQSPGIKNKFIANFTCVRALKFYAENIEDQDLHSKILMFEYSRSRTPQHISLLSERCSADEKTADVTFSTIHKAKGLEWDVVVLLEETALAESLSRVREPSVNQPLPRDEMNLLYVAVTRAKQLLVVNSAVLQVLRLARERMEVLVLGTEVEADSRCLQCTAVVDGKRTLVTKVIGLQVTGMGYLSGGYLCHRCSTDPHFEPNRQRRETVACQLRPSPHEEYSRQARIMLLSKQPSRN